MSYVLQYPDGEFQNWEKTEKVTDLLPEAAHYSDEDEAKEAAKKLNNGMLEDEFVEVIEVD